MERQFCINWSAIIEEAKQRRKAQGLTQVRLAMMAGVSTPTVSRFENGAKDIQLSSVINILMVLGLNDQRTLVFPALNAHYLLDQRVVMFSGQDRSHIIHCAISEEALKAHFNSEEKNALKVFQANRDKILHMARRKYLADLFEVDGSVLLTTVDDFF